MVSYLDRMVMAIAIPYIATEFGLSATSMGVVMSAFFFGYATCQIPGGILVDKFGARKVMIGTILFWSGMTVVSGAMWSLTSLVVARVFFGIGEGLQPPSAHKTISHWFTTKERSFAVSTMITANVVGSAFAPLIAVPIVKETIPHEVHAKDCSAVILLKPAPKGTGVKAGGAVRQVLAHIVANEGPDHEHVRVGEVDEPEHPVHHRVPECDQCVDGTEG